MATLVDETMESYVYPSYNSYSYRYQPPKGKGGAGPPWRQRGVGGGGGGVGGGGVGGYFSGYGEGGAAAVAAAAAEYFDNYQRAQLKAILSQVNPNLTPRLRKANTKEVGVQVNPRQDASVQCSLGPRPLLLRRRGAGGGAAAAEQEQGSPVTGGARARAVRFPRTIAVYSPVASRRLLTTFAEEPSEPPPEPRGVVEQGAGEEEKKKPQVTPPPEEPGGAGEEGAQAEEQDKGQQLPAQPPREQADEEEPGEQAAESGALDEGGQGKARVRFQFLEQKYGYYHCKDCNIRWESAYVWCVQGTNKVYFRQFCRTCQKSYNPYRVEDITCQSCKQTRCTCSVKLRHVDPKRPHRQDLCGRCKGKRLSCDSTFSFKYII